MSASTAPTASARRGSRRNSQTSPGLYGSGNQIAFGILTDAVYVNGGSLRADHLVGGRRRLRVLLDP